MSWCPADSGDSGSRLPQWTNDATETRRCRFEAEGAASATTNPGSETDPSGRDSHAAANDDTRANMKAGASSQDRSDVLIAKTAPLCLHARC